MLRPTAAVLAAATVAALGFMAPSAASASQPGRCDDGVAIHPSPNDGDRILGRCYSPHRVTLYEVVEGSVAICASGPGWIKGSTKWWRMRDVTTGVTGFATVCFVHNA